MNTEKIDLVVWAKLY